MNNLTKQRLKENEVIFRNANENVAQYVEEQIGADGAILPFYCECSRPKCRARIKISTKEYRDIHDNRRQFIALPGHETPEIEVISKKNDGFNVLEKSGPMPSQEAIESALPQLAS